MLDTVTLVGIFLRTNEGNHYRKIRLLGEGNFAKVYVCSDMSSGTLLLYILLLFYKIAFLDDFFQKNLFL